MEPKISLALATKIKILFIKSDDTFLTFPLGLGFTNRFLSFMKSPSLSGLSAQEQFNNQAEFARLFSIITEDNIKWIPDPNRLIWDEVRQTLRNCSYAISALNENENKMLDEAINFLTDTQTQDGLVVPVSSIAVRKYHEYEYAYNERERTYFDEKSTVENSGDEKLMRQWVEYKEKQLHDKMDNAFEEWTTLGFKAQVEFYQDVKNNLEIKKYPILYGSQYQNELNLSEVADPSGSGTGFFSTYFSPSDSFDVNLPWITITLTKGEIETLVQDASEELKKIFNVDQGSTDIESVSLEYSEVTIVRPWFKPEFFTSRYWKLTDNSIISDGNIPRKGNIPSYITSVIVVRNVTITRLRPAGIEPQYAPLVIHALSNVAIQPLRHQLVSTQVIKPQNVIHPAIALTRIEPIRFSHIQVGRLARAKDVPKNKPNFLISKSLTFLTSSRSNIIPKEPLIINPPDENERKSYVKAKFTETTISSKLKKSKFVSIKAKKRSSEPERVTETYSFDGVMVLAFVCKRIPLSPNPDNSLQWS